MRSSALAVALLLGLGLLTYSSAAERCGEGSKPRRGHRLRDLLHRRDCRDCLQLNCGTGKTHHDFGCSGCKAECLFVFGSCWEFFEESCYPKPPPPLAPYPYPHPYPDQRPPNATAPKP